MRKFLISLAAALFLTLGVSGAAFAGTKTYPDWTASISTLQSPINTQKFNIQYSVISLVPATFTVDLYVSIDNGATYGTTPCETQDTNYDPNNVYGGSGTLPACITSDGSYTFKVVITKDGDITDTFHPLYTSTVVNSVAPNPPTYNGKTISGDTYTLNFVAPTTSDVGYVNIYASTSTTYQTDSSTLVGKVNVTPGQSYSFAYTAPNSTTRYFSLQAFDTAGNGSTLVGDPGVIITPVITTSSIQNTSTPGSTSSGQVLGSTTSATSSTGSGQINAPGESSKKIAKSNSGSVLGITKTPISQTKTTKEWETTAAVIVALIVIYLTYISRTGRSLLLKKRTK